MEKEKNQKLVIDGNAFYEIDLDCMEEKKKKTSGEVPKVISEKTPAEYRQ